MKSTQELHQLSVEELAARQVEAQKELQKLRVKATMGVTPENPLKLKQTRKLIARLHTIIHQKRQAQQQQQQTAQQQQKSPPKQQPTQKPTQKPTGGASRP